MPKKTRKMKQRTAMRRGDAAMPPIDGEAGAPKVMISSTRTILAPASRTGLSPATYDYSHIYSDLKRIAFFAVFFFSVLIVLSFVIK